jgi:ABC-2 type transport system permease protein
MNRTLTGLRAGVARGLIELRQSFSGTELIGQLLWPVATLVAIFLLRDHGFGASGFTLGALILPGVLGMFIAFGMLLVVQYLTADREDGTLLRARAIPSGIAGIFYPITMWPQWLQWIAQAFPMYWLGLGMRSALLPSSAVAVEIGHSWRHLETVAVLGAWAVVGLVLAPIVLRRMARRESGSSVAERREKMLKRTA